MAKWVIVMLNKRNTRKVVRTLLTNNFDNNVKIKPLTKFEWIKLYKIILRKKQIFKGIFTNQDDSYTRKIGYV